MGFTLDKNSPYIFLKSLLIYSPSLSLTPSVSVSLSLRLPPHPPLPTCHLFVEGNLVFLCCSFPQSGLCCLYSRGVLERVLCPLYFL